ncbi:selenium cofactor biosynthesis protein YqeC [Chloroflexota bacterium]
MDLRKAFDIKPGEVISLVGGGGKTSLMLALASELVASGKSVITTTTTKIREPLPSQTQFLLIAPEDEVVTALKQGLRRYQHITVAAQKLPPRKLKGVSPQVIVALSQLSGIDYIIVEADGAARRPLKAPNSTEPVVPPNTSLFIAVMGIDALGLPLAEENVHRAEIVSRLTGQPIGQTVSSSTIITLAAHPEGMFKGSPAGARNALFINKMDLPASRPQAREIAARILEASLPQLDRVVLGQTRRPNPAVEVLRKNLTGISG